MIILLILIIYNINKNNNNARIMILKVEQAAINRIIIIRWLLLIVPDKIVNI
jgi:hypothetical protein